MHIYAKETCERDFTLSHTQVTTNTLKETFFYDNNPTKYYKYVKRDLTGCKRDLLTLSHTRNTTNTLKKTYSYDKRPVKMTCISEKRPVKETC